MSKCLHMHGHTFYFVGIRCSAQNNFPNDWSIFFFLHLSPITCAVSISWNLSHQEKIDVKTNTTFRLYAAYGLVTERARENVYEIEDFFSLVREYACIICTNYLMQRERATSQCVIKEESIHVYFMAINISDMCLHYYSNSNTDSVAKFYLFV